MTMQHGAGFTLPFQTGGETPIGKGTFSYHEQKRWSCFYQLRMLTFKSCFVSHLVSSSLFLCFSCRYSCPGEGRCGSLRTFPNRRPPFTRWLPELPTKASGALFHQLSFTQATTQDEWLPGLTGSPTGTVGGRLVCHALQDPTHQTSGVHAGGHWGHHGTWHQTGPGAHHCRPHISWSWQLCGHWHVCGVWPGSQGNGGAWCHRVLHHRCSCIYFIRWVSQGSEVLGKGAHGPGCCLSNFPRLFSDGMCEAAEKWLPVLSLCLCFQEDQGQIFYSIVVASFSFIFFNTNIYLVPQMSPNFSLPVKF